VTYAYVVLDMQASLEAYASREIMRIFKGHTLVATNEALPGSLEIDFHFKDNEGKDVFVDVDSNKIDRSKLSKILNLYSSISNVYPSLRNFELVVVGPVVSSLVRKELEGLSIRLLAFKELGITRRKLGQIGEDRRQMRVRNLSPDEATLVVKWEAEKRIIVRAVDVKSTLNCGLNYSYGLLHSLEKKGWLERIKKGTYQFVPAGYGLYPNKIPPANPFAVGAAFVSPYYFSYYTANGHYGFTTQMPFTYFVATTKKKANVEWQSVVFEFVTLTKRKFFGYEAARVFDVEVCMAEPEKSIVDSFDKPHYAGGIEQLARIVWRGLPRINQDMLVDYALRMKSHSLVQRLGFVIDFLAKEGLVEPLSSNLSKMLSSYVGRSVVYLDARKPKKGAFSGDWNIMNNLSREQLLSEIEVR
jgi:predicted transcriptional regulator of viral defense system